MAVIVRQLADLRGALSVMDGAPSADDTTGPTVDPRLVTSYSPRAMWRSGDGFDPVDIRLFATRLADFACDLPGPAPGLVIGRNSDTPPVRNGWNGITPFARRSVHRSCAVLEEWRQRLAFWTVTLSPAQLDWIQAHDSWPAFQSAIRHRLVRKLRARGLRPLVVGVVELHPERSMREGRPCPHIHVVFVGRSHRWARWSLSTVDLDLIICKALIAAGCFDLDVRAAGRVEPVRYSCGAYLSHYLKKGSGPPPVCLDLWQLIPRQWFFQSRAMLRLVRSLTVARPVAFVAWVHEHHGQLEHLQLASWQQVAIPDPRAPAVFSVIWESPGAVAAAVAMWQESLWDAEWGLNHNLGHDRYHACQHS